MRKASLIKRVTDQIEVGDLAGAERTLREKCPDTPLRFPKEIARPASSGAGPKTTDGAPAKRNYSNVESTRLFIRDGFVDRYSGDRLVYPGVLRLISHMFPAEFPYHPNWKIGVGHSWYWDLFPTVDHVLAVTRGGEDGEANWVTTSMMRNLIKSNRTLEELDWTLHSPGRFDEWDGLLLWYVRFIDEHDDARRVSFLGKWYRAARAALRPT